MKTVRNVSILCSCLALPAYLTAQSTVNCVSRAETQAMTAFFMPALVDVVAKQCSGAFLDKSGKDTSGFQPAMLSLSGQYEPASNEAWPLAKGVIARIISQRSTKKIGDRFVASMIENGDPNTIRALAASFIITKPIKPKTCSLINRVLPDFAQLPSKNVTSLMAILIEEIAVDSQKMPFTICAVPNGG
jgi:hypothetical protein